MKTVFIRSLTVASLTALALASPSHAQQRVQDFTLPPNPTPTPTIEGPVDDSGLVPVAPRAIPSDTPSPTPSPPEAQQAGASSETEGTRAIPSGATSGTPVVQEILEEAQSPSPASTQSAGLASAQAPGLSADVGPIPLQTPTPLDLDLPVQSNPVGPAPANTQEIEPQAGGLLAWWIWAAGLLAALLAGLAGGWWMAQRRTASLAPKIKPPIATTAAKPEARDAAAHVPAHSLRITLEPEQLMRSIMMLTLHYRLVIANRSDVPLHNVKIASDLISAKRAAPVEQQLATTSAQLPYTAQLDRIGPQQTATITGQLQLPLNEIEIFQQGQTPLCVPLARFRFDSEGIEPQLRTFLVGLGSGNIGGKVHPLPLSGPPGGYEVVRARALD